MSCGGLQRVGQPCTCGCTTRAAQMGTMGSVADWFRSTDDVPDFGGTDRAAVAAYLLRAKWTHTLRGGMIGFLAGGIVAGLLLSISRSGVAGKVRDRVVDATLDRYIPRGGRR